MDRRTGDPVDAVVRERIERQLDTWRAEHPGWGVEYIVPLDFYYNDPTNKIPYLMLVFGEPTSIGVGWYSKYLINRALMNFIAETSLESVLHLVNEILLGMQSDIGRMRSGADPAT